MDVSGLDNGTVKLTPDKMTMKQKKDMAIFHVIGWSLKHKESGQGLRMEIILKRKI